MKETNMTTMKKLSSKPVPDNEMTKMVDSGISEPSTPAPKFASKSLDSLIKSKVVGKMPSQVVTDKLKESIEQLEEMTMGSTTAPSGKKVSWISHPGIGHSVSVNDLPVHSGFLDHKSAAALYAKHIKA